MHIIIEVSGNSIEYCVPVIKVSDYSIEYIFNRKQYILIPFYIFSHEKDFDNYNTNSNHLEKLYEEYQYIISRLDKLVEWGEITAFDRSTILELSKDVIQELTKKHTNLQRKVGELMQGEIIYTEARRLRDEGISIGFRQGISQGRIEAYIDMIKDGIISISDAAKRLKVSEDLIKEKL